MKHPMWYDRRFQQKMDMDMDATSVQIERSNLCLDSMQDLLTRCNFSLINTQNYF